MSPKIKTQIRTLPDFEFSASPDKFFITALQVLCPVSILSLQD